MLFRLTLCLMVAVAVALPQDHHHRHGHATSQRSREDGIGIHGDSRRDSRRDSRSDSHSDEDSHEHGHHGYRYSYSVDDPHTGDRKSAQEHRRGNEVTGSYSLVEPDGNVRTVKYVADKGGFRARVHFKRPSIHDPPRHHHGDHHDDHGRRHRN